MNKAKPYNKSILNFSNVFSPKHRSPLRNNLFNQTHKQIKTKSKSPNIQGDALVNIPNIKTFKQTHKIALNNEKMKTMFERLEVEEKAQRNFLERTKKNNLYMEYAQNPFTSHLSQSSDLDANKLVPRPLGSKDLVQEFNRLRDPRIKQKQSKLKQRGLQVKNSPLLNLQDFKGKKKDKQPRIAHHSPQPTRIQQQKSTELQQFDNIIQMNQTKYIPSQSKNIFSILFHNREFKTSQQTINQYNFCYDSMVTFSTQTKQKHFKIHPLLEISTYNRQMVRNIFTDKIPQKMVLNSGDINILIDRIQFRDMANVASNRLSSQNLAIYFKEIEAPLRKKANKQNQNENKDMITYLPNTGQKKINYDNIDQDKIDIKYYEQAAFNRYEILQQELSDLSMKELQAAIDLEIHVINNTIQDKKLLKTFRGQKDKILLKQLDTNSDMKLTQLMKEVERKIRMNKNNKNRAQKIKIEALTQSLRIKNQRQSKSKGKSPRAQFLTSRK